jgi:hypothetical protein
MEFLDLTINNLTKIINSKPADEAAEITQALNAVKNNRPDDYLSVLQKRGDLAGYQNYWRQRVKERPQVIKDTLKDKNRSLIEVLIDLHILGALKRPSKVVFEDNKKGIPGRPGYQTDIVKEFGCSREAVSRLARGKDYRIIYTPSGMINIDATIKALRETDFPNSNNKKRKKEERDEPGDPLTPEEFESDIKESGPLKITDSRARISKHKDFHQAEKGRIENEIKLKELINLNEVGDKSFGLWRQVRDEIQALKDRCAIKIRSAESDHEAEQILHDETHRILSSIVNGYQDLDDEGLKKKLLLRLTK